MQISIIDNKNVVFGRAGKNIVFAVINIKEQKTCTHLKYFLFLVSTKIRCKFNVVNNRKHFKM